MRKYKSSKCVTFFPNKLLPTFNLCDVIQYATFIILHIEIIFMMSKTKFTRLAQFPPPQKKKTIEITELLLVALNFLKSLSFDFFSHFHCQL